MLDFCQLSNRLTEHKYYGTYGQLADMVKKYSSAPMLDVQRFWEIVIFSWITGNSDMHCKNFSLIDTGNGEYSLSPAYDLLPVLLADPEDTEEMAMAFRVGGRKSGFDKSTFIDAMCESGLSEEQANFLIQKIAANRPEWEQLISESFLPENLKKSYLRFLDDRMRKMSPYTPR